MNPEKLDMAIQLLIPRLSIRPKKLLPPEYPEMPAIYIVAVSIGWLGITGCTTLSCSSM